jgi:hypothetical protein
LGKIWPVAAALKSIPIRVGGWSSWSFLKEELYSGLKFTILSKIRPVIAEMFDILYFEVIFRCRLYSFETFVNFGLVHIV